MPNSRAPSRSGVRSSQGLRYHRGSVSMHESGLPPSSVAPLGITHSYIQVPPALSIDEIRNLIVSADETHVKRRVCLPSLDPSTTETTLPPILPSRSQHAHARSASARPRSRPSPPPPGMGPRRLVGVSGVANEHNSHYHAAQHTNSLHATTHASHVSTTQHKNPAHAPAFASVASHGLFGGPAVAVGNSAPRQVGGGIDARGRTAWTPVGAVANHSDADVGEGDAHAQLSDFDAVGHTQDVKIIITTAVTTTASSGDNMTFSGGPLSLHAPLRPPSAAARADGIVDGDRGADRRAVAGDGGQSRGSGGSSNSNGYGISSGGSSSGFSLPPPHRPSSAASSTPPTTVPVSGIARSASHSSSTTSLRQSRSSASFSSSSSSSSLVSSAPFAPALHAVAAAPTTHTKHSSSHARPRHSRLTRRPDTATAAAAAATGLTTSFAASASPTAEAVADVPSTLSYTNAASTISTSNSASTSASAHVSPSTSSPTTAPASAPVGCLSDVVCRVLRDAAQRCKALTDADPQLRALLHPECVHCGRDLTLPLRRAATKVLRGGKLVARVVGAGCRFCDKSQIAAQEERGKQQRAPVKRDDPAAAIGPGAYELSRYGFVGEQQQRARNIRPTAVSGGFGSHEGTASAVRQLMLERYRRDKSQITAHLQDALRNGLITAARAEETLRKFDRRFVPTKPRNCGVVIGPPVCILRRDDSPHRVKGVGGDVVGQGAGSGGLGKENGKKKPNKKKSRSVRPNTSESSTDKPASSAGSGGTGTSSSGSARASRGGYPLGSLARTRSFLGALQQGWTKPQ